MANCHDLFKSFDKVIALPDSGEEKLRTARNAIRDRIRKDFSERKRTPVPEFAGQGSYALNTIVNPIDGEYDIDDGVYLQNLEKTDNSDWPTPETVHKWIIDAVTGHTDQPPIDKRTCVRVVYAGEYHVDLPIYAELLGENLHAEKGEKGWHRSDPKAVISWFQKAAQEYGDQLRRTIRYFKAWADYNSKDGRLPSGFVLTVLTVNEFVEHDRDDVCFGMLAKAAHSRLLSSPSLPNPVDPLEDLLTRYDVDQQQRFIQALFRLRDVAANALTADKKVEACRRWRTEFGRRWPNCDELQKDDKALYTVAPAILRNDARSAWK